MPPFLQMIFSDAFLRKKSFVFWFKFHCIGLDNGLPPYKRQAIIWTSTDLIHWRTYAAQGGDELIIQA